MPEAEQGPRVLAGPTRDGLGELLALLHSLGGIATRTELTDRLGCSRSVMGYLLHELTERAVVSIDPARREAGVKDAGRPSHHVTIAPTAPVAIALQLNVDYASVATVCLGGRILDRSDLSLRRTLRLETVMDRLCAMIAARAETHSRIIGIGMAVPSPVRRSDGLALAPCHLGWPTLPLRELLADRLSRIRTLDALPVHVGNDANLAALAEYHHGAGRGAMQLLYLTTAHVGLGGALISQGRLFDGAHGYAMELSHLTVDPRGAECGCGSRGCLDVEADHRGLLRAARRPTDKFHNVALDAEEILDTAGTNDQKALYAVRHVAAHLGSGLASLINLTDPDRIILSGSLARYQHLAPKSLADNLSAKSFLSHMEPAVITSGTLSDATLVGAADLAFQLLLDNPRSALAMPNGDERCT